MEPLNSPIELGVRALVLLRSIHPSSADLSRLLLMDYCLMHSADVGGPSSILPEVPGRNSEIGIRRTEIEHGIRLMARVGMIDILLTANGIEYRASEEAQSFLQILQSSHTAALADTASWVAAEFGGLEEDQIRNRLYNVSISLSAPPSAHQTLSSRHRIAGGDQ